MPPQQHIGDLLIAVLSAGGAEGDLDGGQAVGHQNFTQGERLVYAVEGDDGDNTDVGNCLADCICQKPSLITGRPRP